MTVPAASNAKITVELDGRTRSFELNGDELSRIDLGHGYVNHYLNNASRTHFGDEVEKALISLAKENQ